MVSDEEHFDLS